MRARSPLKMISVVAALVLATTASLSTSSTSAWADYGPDPPTNLRVTQVEPGSFTVEWDPVDGADFYRVQLYFPGEDRGRGAPRRVYENPTETFMAAWGGTYEVSVQVRMAGTYSPWSERVTVTTPLPEGYEPPSAPTNLRVAERNAQGEALLIRWDAPARGTGPFEYTIYIDHPEMQGRFDRTAQLSYDARNLPLNVGYFDVPGLTVTLWVSVEDRALGIQEVRSKPLHLVCCPF